MSSLPSNYQTILNNLPKDEEFEKKWPVIARLLGMDAEVKTGSIELSKNDNPVMTIFKAGGIEVYSIQSEEFIKKIMILAVREANKG